MAKLHVSIVVDWEGEHFRNVGDLRATREAIQTSLGAHVPFTHFICPTYWLEAQPAVDPSSAIRAVLTRGDETALHVHCWAALVRAAEVPFRATPDWNHDGTGHGVPLGAYGDDVPAIVRTARELLQRKLGVTVHGFRCGGALTCDAVYEALMALGFRYDCSAFPPAVVSRGFGPNARGNLRDTYGTRTALAGFLVDLWGSKPVASPQCSNRLTLRANRGPITPTTQPYWVRSNERRILEMPGNGGISDYASADSMRAAFDTLLAQARASPHPLFFNIGCHQEGAGRWKRPLSDFCHERRAELGSDAVVMTTVARASKTARRFMSERQTREETNR